MAAGNGPREPLNGAQAGKQRHQSKLSVSQLKNKTKQDWIAQLRDTDQTVHLLFMWTIADRSDTENMEDAVNPHAATSKAQDVYRVKTFHHQLQVPSALQYCNFLFFVQGGN